MFTTRKMHLTHDESLTLWAKARQVRARVRVWQGGGCDPVVLVESRDEREVGVYAHKVATYVRYGLLRGRQPFYIEHDTLGQWSIVRFGLIRHAYTGGERANFNKATAEAVIGDTID